MDVSLEIHSNWGHPGRVGLTEIQIYDLAGRRIPVKAEDVFVKRAVNASGNIDVLFSGKYKVRVEVVIGRLIVNWQVTLLIILDASAT